MQRLYNLRGMPARRWNAWLRKIRISIFRNTSNRSANGNKSVQLNTSRLLLREYAENDWHAVLAYQRDPRYLRFYAWDARTEKDVCAFVRQLKDEG